MEGEEEEMGVMRCGYWYFPLVELPVRDVATQVEDVWIEVEVVAMVLGTRVVETGMYEVVWIAGLMIDEVEIRGVTIVSGVEET